MSYCQQCADLRAQVATLRTEIEALAVSRKAWMKIAANGAVSLNKLADAAKTFYEQNFKLGNEQHLKDDTARETEFCAKCGFTRYNHIGNTGCVFPCWTPSGEYSTDRNTNRNAAGPAPEKPRE